MRFNKILLGSGMLLAAFGATVTPGGRLQAQQAGDTGYAQGGGVTAKASSTNTSVFPAAPMDDPRMADAVTFTVRVENISKGNVLMSAKGGEAPFAIAPGLAIVHMGSNPLFKPGSVQAGEGLEPLAEDGNPAVLAGTEQGNHDVLMGVVYDTPVGASAPGPAGPGNVFEYTIMAPPGARLSFTEMFGQSNDLFYGPGKKGIALFDAAGKPVSGNVTKEVVLWDAGTEMNQEPGFGPDQAPRQPAPNTGSSEKKPVGPVKDTFTYPPVAQVLRITVTPAS